MRPPEDLPPFSHLIQLPWHHWDRELMSGSGRCPNGLDHFAAAAAMSLQSCPTLCDPMDCSLPGFSIHGILQARTMKWVAISFSNAWKWKVKVKSLSRVQIVTPWTAAYQAPPSIGFSRQEYWSGVPLGHFRIYNQGQKWYGPKQKQKILWRGGKNTQENCTKKIFMTQIITIVWSLT